MRLSNTLSAVAALATLVLATEHVYITNSLDHPVWYTQVDQYSRGPTVVIGSGGTAALEQSDNPGVAIKITPGQYDIDIAGKGVLTLAYNKHPEGWIYYDIGSHNYFPFSGSRTKLSGPGGESDWADGQEHAPHTIGYFGYGDLYLNIGY